MKKRVAFLLALVLIGSLVLTACSSGGDAGGDASTGGEAPPADTGESAAEAGGEEETFEFTFMHHRTEEEVATNVEAQIFDRRIKEWLEDHPNVTINQISMTQTDYQTKIMALAAADDMPDLFLTKGSWVSNFYSNGVAADITEYVDQSQYRDGIFGPFTREGKVIAMPYQCNVTHMIYYNEEMWKEAGFDTFPDNWDDIDKANEYFKAQGIDTFSFGNIDKWQSESCIISALGDRITGTDWTRSIISGDGTAKFTDPEFVETLSFLQGMSKYFPADFNAITHQQASTYYINGKSAGHIDGIWNVGYLTGNAPQEIIDVTKTAVLPAVDGGKGAANTTSGGPVWAQSISSKLTGAALDMAVQFTLDLYNIDFSQEIINETGAPQIHNVTPADVDALEPVAKSALETVNNLTLVPIYDGEMEASVIEVMNTNLQTLLGGTITPEEVAALIQAEQDKIGA